MTPQDTKHNTNLLATIRLATDPLATDLRDLRNSVTQLLAQLNKKLTEHTQAIDSLTKLHETQSNLTTRLNTIEDAIESFRNVIVFLRWLGLGTGGLTVVLLWNIFTGQVVIVFK